MISDRWQKIEMFKINFTNEPYMSTEQLTSNLNYYLLIDLCHRLCRQNVAVVAVHYLLFVMPSVDSCHFDLLFCCR